VANKNKPTTTLKVRLLNGEQAIVEPNMDTKLQEVHDHVSTVSGVSQFELCWDYPLKKINLDLTVEQAGIAGCALTQKPL
jgi:hypothetical protein